MYEIYKAAREAYELAIKSGHTEELQEVACKESSWAYYYAMDVEGADIRYCQEWARKEPERAYWFAKYVEGADTNYCQEMACKEPYWAYYYAMDVEGADIRYCQEMACKDPYWAYCFAGNVVGADLEACLEAVKDTELEDKVRKMVIDGVIGQISESYDKYYVAVNNEHTEELQEKACWYAYFYAYEKVIGNSV